MVIIADFFLFANGKQQRKNDLLYKLPDVCYHTGEVNIMQNISHNIRNLRKKRELTQEDLAAQLHVTRQAVSSWERGGSCPDFDMLKALSEVL